MTSWPWDLPNDWSWCKWGDVAQVASALTDPALYPSLPHIAPNNIESQTGRLLPYRSVAEDGVISPKHHFYPGQVLYSKIRPYLAKVTLAEFEGLCSADMYPITTDLDPAFLKMWMLTPEFTRLAAGEQARTVLPKINVRSLSSLPVPVPPMDEQRRIVAILEDHLSRLDAAIAGVTHTRALAETAWRSCLAEVLSRARKTGKAKVLGEISTTRLGKMLDAKRNSGTATPYLRNQNVQWRQIDAVDVLQVPLSSEEVSEFAIVEGDLLVCEGGEPGRCAVVTATPDGPLAFQKALHRVRVHDELDPHFLQLTLESMAVSGDLDRHFTGTTIKHFPQERLRALTIWVPDKVAQGSIVEEASSLRLALDRVLIATERASRQAENLRRSVLNAAFSGQLTRESINV